MRWEKAAKLVTLARELASTREGLTLDEMAEWTGVERRTAERMRDALRDLFPGLEEVADGRNKRFRIIGGMSAFEIAPTADELAELEAGIRQLAMTGNDARAALLRSLSSKVRAAQKAEALRRLAPDLEALLSAESLAMQAGPRPLVAAATLAVLRDAIKALTTVHFRYRDNNRHVDPWGLLLGRVPYLVGPAVGRPEPVLWRLDRIEEIVVAGTGSRRPSDFDLATYAARSFGTFQEEIHDIKLRFTPKAAVEARRFLFHPHQMLIEEADGSLVVSFSAGGLLELVHHLFSWGDGVSILAPSELRKLMCSELNCGIKQHDHTAELHEDAFSKCH